MDTINFDPSNTILLIDDAADLRLILSQSFKAMGLNVLDAPDAESGLNILRQIAKPIKAIVTDYELPSMNGIEFLNEVIKEHLDPSTIVLVSGNFDHEKVLEFLMNYKALEIFVLDKPFKLEHLTGLLLCR